MFKVTYTVKNENGYLVEKTKKFEILREAFVFVRELNVSQKTVGKPTIERY